MAFARRNAATKVVAQDFATVLNVTRAKVTAAGLDSQYEFLPGSAFTVDLGQGYDVILVTNLYHHFDMPTCETLMRRFHAALADGGRMLILEMVPNEDRISPPAPASFAMMMLVNTPSGDAFTLTEDAAFSGNVLTNDSVAFAARMLEGAGIAATPGVDFDRTRGSRFLRFSYCGDEAAMAEAPDRLRSWLPR
jgi:hypothetical protein